MGHWKLGYGLMLIVVAGCSGSDAGTSPKPGGSAVKDNYSPRIASFTKSGDRLTPSLTVTFEATITDPQGSENIASVKLLDEYGTSYGTLEPVAEASYAITLDWTRAHEVQGISGGPEGLERSFQLEVVDRDDHHSSARLQLKLSCDSGNEGPCNGTCQDMLEDEFNCGGCNLQCPGASANPNSPVSYCREALCHEVYESFDERTSCSQACATVGGTCDHDDLCPGEICDLEEQSWAEYGNMALRVPLSGCDAVPEASVDDEPFSRLHCNCDRVPAVP